MFNAPSKSKGIMKVKKMPQNHLLRQHVKLNSYQKETTNKQVQNTSYYIRPIHAWCLFFFSLRVLYHKTLLINIHKITVKHHYTTSVSDVPLRSIYARYVLALNDKQTFLVMDKTVMRTAYKDIQTRKNLIPMPKRPAQAQKRE